MSRRLFYGRDDSGNVVFKMSKPGIDAKSATDEQLQIGEQKDVPRLVASGTLNLIGKTVAVVNFEEVSRSPIVFARTIRSGDYIQEPYNRYGFGDGGIWYQASTNVVNFLSESDRNIMYQIFTKAG